MQLTMTDQKFQKLQKWRLYETSVFLLHFRNFTPVRRVLESYSLFRISNTIRNGTSFLLMKYSPSNSLLFVLEFSLLYLDPNPNFVQKFPNFTIFSAQRSTKSIIQLNTSWILEQCWQI